MKVIGGLDTRQRIERAAIKLYLANGVEATTNKMLTSVAQVSPGSLGNAYSTKEDLLLVCCEYVAKKQKKFFADLKEKYSYIDLYALDVAVELFMCENNPSIKDVYSKSYSMPRTMEYIRNAFYKKSEEVFKEHLPNWTEQDFFEAEITKSGIMFGYIMESANPYFTQEHKIKRCLTSILKLYEFEPDERKRIIERVVAEDIETYSKQFVAYIQDSETEI